MLDMMTKKRVGCVGFPSSTRTTPLHVFGFCRPMAGMTITVMSAGLRPALGVDRVQCQPPVAMGR
jgi:hypothetical protein